MLAGQGAWLMVFQSLSPWTSGVSVVHTYWFSVPFAAEGLRAMLGGPGQKGD